ncbi:uncharacterized protein LOC135834170 [Planococcus citri]|uniref:uncharacterized protein LOC135834170 n=1 Tax=Planococcus citri TaxID=170843 RepID=UPI0031F82B86
MKADKGNAIVVMEKEDYNNKVNDLLKNGPYKELTKNPLNNMIKTTKTAIKNKNYKIPSNPKIPKLYCLPKIHKPNNPMRPIVSNIDAPTYQIAKQLVTELQAINQPITYQIRNNEELVEKLKNTQITPTDRLISFDVTNLFPSVPIPETLAIMKDWLQKEKVSQERIAELMNLTELCMKQTIFQYSGKFYQQTGGTAMGNPLSPFMADIFMGHLETKLKEIEKDFPKICFRYVDDIFSIVPEDFNINGFLETMNKQYATIKFTYEYENNQQLPFLDILITRKDNKLEYDIYRKPTHTNNYIPADSYQPWSQKLAAFNSMVHRCCAQPLSPRNRKREFDHIKRVANNLGYKTRTIDTLIKNHISKQRLKEITTFQRDKPDNRRIKLTHYPVITNKLCQIFRKNDLEPVTTNQHKLKTLLGSLKDKDPKTDQSGIYKITCSGCDKLYIGQTKRNIITRYKEHMHKARYNIEGKSAIGDHIIATGHTITELNLTLEKPVARISELPIREAIAMHKNNREKLLNDDLGPLDIDLLKCLHGTSHIHIPTNRHTHPGSDHTQVLGPITTQRN